MKEEFYIIEKSMDMKGRLERMHKRKNPDPEVEARAAKNLELERAMLNIGPKEGRVPSYGSPAGHPTGKPAPGLPASTMGKAKISPGEEGYTDDFTKRLNASLKNTKKSLYEEIDLIKGE